MGDEHEPQERIPPQDIAAEAAVLGSMLLDGQAARELSVSLRPEMFWRNAHRIVFECLQGIVQRGAMPDEVILRDALGARLEEMGGSEYIHTLASSVPSAANADHYARIVREKWVQRALITAATAILREAEDGPGDMNLMVNKAIERVSELLPQTAANKPITIEESLEESFTEAPAWKIGNPKHLQDCTGGIRRGGVVLVTGFPGTGKTTLFLQLIFQAASEKQKCYIFSVDQPHRSLSRKILAAFVRMPADDLTREHGKAMEGLPVVFHPGRFRLSEVVATIHAEAAKGVTMFMVDYLSLLEVPGTAQKWEKSVEAVQALKSAALQCDVYMLVVQSITRGEHARGGVEIEHAVDQLWKLKKLTLDWELAHIKDEGFETLEVMKNRAGRLAMAELDFHREHCYFDDWHKARPAGGME